MPYAAQRAVGLLGQGRAVRVVLQYHRRVRDPLRDQGLEIGAGGSRKVRGEPQRPGAIDHAGRPHADANGSARRSGSGTKRRHHLGHRICDVGPRLHAVSVLGMGRRHPGLGHHRAGGIQCDAEHLGAADVDAEGDALV